MAENGINVYQSNKHYEVAPIMSLSQHEANNNVVWVSDKVWNSLNDQQKGWVQAAADEVAKVKPPAALSLENNSMAKLEKMGIKFVKDVDKSGFIKDARADPGSARREAGARRGQRAAPRARREIGAVLASFETRPAGAPQDEDGFVME